MKNATLRIVLLSAVALATLPRASARPAAAATPVPAAAHSVSLAWTAIADRLTGYIVYRSTCTGSYGGAPLNGGVPVGGVSYTDATVTPGTYFYVVRGVVVAGATQTESA